MSLTRKGVVNSTPFFFVLIFDISKNLVIFEEDYFYVDKYDYLCIGY